MKYYTSVAKELKLKVRNFWRLIRTFVEATGEKMVGGEGGLFAPLLILNRVKDITERFLFSLFDSSVVSEIVERVHTVNLFYF